MVKYTLYDHWSKHKEKISETLEAFQRDIYADDVEYVRNTEKDLKMFQAEDSISDIATVPQRYGGPKVACKYSLPFIFLKKFSLAKNCRELLHDSYVLFIYLFIYLFIILFNVGTLK